MTGGSFGVYILSIAGAVVIMTVADIIMPEGQTSKYLKSILSLFLVLIIISPLPDMLKKGADINSYFTENAFESDYTSFITSLNAKKAAAVEEKTEKYLEGLGYKGIEVRLVYTGNTEGINIDYVHLDLTNLVFNNNGEHINIIDNIVEYVSVYLGAAKENIYTYGAD